MFTGIVQEVGTIKKIEKQDRARNIYFGSPKLIKQIKPGLSVSVNGVCSTVERKAKGFFRVNYMLETVEVTTIGAWVTGQKVNLEPSLKIGDELSGHLVFGHVDGLGRVVRVSRKSKAVVVQLKAPKGFDKYLAYKGSVSVDGVSLTIAKSSGCIFQVALIPYTLKHTTLNLCKVGDYVNLEADMLAKYAVNYLKNVKRK